MQLSNRELSRRLNVDLAKWKRWSRTFLLPDPRAGMQRGVTREYTIEDAFTVHLGGYLLGTLKLSAVESRKIIKYLVPSVLQEIKVFPMSTFRERLHGHLISWTVDILRWKRGFVYTAKGLIAVLQCDSEKARNELMADLGGSFEMPQNCSVLFKEWYVSKDYGPLGAEFDRNRLVGVLPVTLLASRFLALLK
jgi:hypothetical protein